ncbi:MAG: histidine kinase [Gammaproteobacteria bacterium]|nr:MAG: histidine kinase [Gammaproteobacteria bacterium]RKZ92361.1 MAG: histidine kinase [Gammaproteobacteria bacterium]RKZ98848.1 MAG: histidine kinase [Gammaproteobacteria bacterium]RLA01744.1 MAG: histidine kinase [Gammaproteobacteria bacterium]
MSTDYSQITVARQPIFDKNLNTYAYELLYRSRLESDNIEADGSFDDVATSNVISYTFMDFGLDRVVGNRVAFLNMTRNFLIDSDPLPMVKDQVVLEILEDIIVDDEVVAGVKNLVEQGYKIALDDFIFNESWWPLIKLAHIIKLDILAIDEQQLRQHVEMLKKEDVLLLAEKVETQEQYEMCKELDFDFYQGYFFTKPTLVQDVTLAANQVSILNLLTKLQNPGVEFDEIEQIVSTDLNLSYKLLKLLNSAAVGLPRKIDSIHQGLVILGFRAIRSWSTLIALSSIKTDIPELMTVGLVRAKMCEQIADEFGVEKETAFLVGLFSVLEALMAHPMSELLTLIPLSDSVKEALLDQSGELGPLLKTVMLYEQGLWDNITDSPLDKEQLSTAYVDAAYWTINTELSQ